MLPIVRFYFLYLLAAQVGFSMFMLYARQAGYSLTQLTAYGAFLYIAPITLIPLLRQLPTRRSFLISLVAIAMGMGCMSQLHRGVAWYWLTGPTVGVTMATFWVVYMIRHVTAGPERANAYNSSVIVFVLFAAGCISPLIGGAVGRVYGATGNAIASVLLLCVAATQIRSIKPRTISFRFASAWRATPRYARALLVLQGMYEALQFLYLPICTTFYLTEPMRFGVFFSAVAFVGSCANLFISRWSDRVGNRSRMIYFGCGLMIAGAATLATARGLVQWSIGAPLLHTGFTLTLPYFIAVILDAVPNTDDALVVREWGCNLGRMATVIVALLIVRATGNLQYAFFWGLVPLVGYAAVLYLAERRGLVTPVAPHIPAATTADAQAEGTATL